MQGTPAPTFRPTVWPAEPPRVPPVTRYRLEYEGDSLRVLDVDRERGPVDLPPDFALRELLEVSSDPAAVVAFMQEWGLLVDLLPEGRVLDLHEAQRRLRTLQTLARHLLSDRDGDLAAVKAAWHFTFGEEPAHREQAWTWFQHHMHRALAPFTVHVRLGPQDDAALTLRQPNLYNAVALQLTLYVAGDGPISRCANERCRLPFTIQRSGRRRYEATHHASGVRYCSHLCAKAQSERDRRARRRADKEQQS